MDRTPPQAPVPTCAQVSKQDRTPQSKVKDGHDRLFARLHRDPWIDPVEAEQELARQIRYETPMFGSSRRRTGWAAVFSMSPGD
jgi:hypothetical protein